MRHGETMRYLSTTAAQRAEMLRVIGVDDVEALIETLLEAPVTMPVRRLDQTLAARQPNLRWTPRGPTP